MHSTVLVAVSGFLAMAHAAPSKATRPSAASNCPDVNGTFPIENYRLYPENLDWDPVHCRLYLRQVLNRSEYGMRN